MGALAGSPADDQGTMDGRLVRCARARRLPLLAALALTASLATAPGAAAQSPFGPSVAGVPAPTGAPKADRDRDGVFDDLAARLDRASEDTRVRVIVSLEEAASVANVGGIERAVGDFALEERFGIIDGFAATVTKGQVRRLAARGDVRHVEEDAVVRAHNGGAQTSFGTAAARAQVPGLDGDADGDPAAYSAGDLVAAVIDTGIDAGHVALDGGKVLAFQDFINGRTAAYDDNGHGTHVAGTIAGDGDGSAGNVDRGVAPRAGLIGLKTLAADGSGLDSGTIAALDWVVRNRATYGIEVVNLSLGSAGCNNGTDGQSRAVDAAHDAGLVVAVSAGNSGPGTCTIGSPGAAAKALTVGNMADSAKSGYYQAHSSSRGPTLDGRVKPDVSAPGVFIRSAKANATTGYVGMTGTSMAAPFVAGTALLMLERAPALTPQQVKDKMMQTAVDWGRGGNNQTAGSTGADIDYGAGRLDAYAAISSAGAALTSPPATPGHFTREGTLQQGGFVDFPLVGQGGGLTVAGTLIESVVTPGAAFSLELLRGDGSSTVIAPRNTGRQEVLAATGITTGDSFILRVRSVTGSGSFFLDVSGASPPDVTPPETSIVSGPAGTVTSRSAEFGFASTEAGSFECRLDGAATWSPCASPTSYSSLPDGAHVFEVRAIDAAGNVDQTPAARGWTVAPTPTPTPTATPTPSATPAPTPTPTPTPTPRSTPTPSATPSPTPTPTPAAEAQPGSSRPTAVTLAPAPFTGPRRGVPVDTTAPGVSIGFSRQRLATVRKKGLGLTLKCSEACGATISLEGAKRAGRPVVIGRGTLSLPAAGTRTTLVRLTVAGRRALRRVEPAKLVIRVAAADPAGNRRTVTRSVTLKR